MIYPTMLDEIRDHNVTVLEANEGTKISIGDNISITWKAQGKDTGYAFGCYEIELGSDSGIPIHKHPYAEFFYVIEGTVDFQKVNDRNEYEWVKCGPGATVLAPPNAPHAFFNSSRERVKFVAVSTYHHELMIKQSKTPTGTLSEGYDQPTEEGFEKLKQSQELDQVFYLK